jgi:hypothetical protein
MKKAEMAAVGETERNTIKLLIINQIGIHENRTGKAGISGTDREVLPTP